MQACIGAAAQAASLLGSSLHLPQLLSKAQHQDLVQPTAKLLQVIGQHKQGQPWTVWRQLMCGSTGLSAGLQGTEQQLYMSAPWLGIAP